MGNGSEVYKNTLSKGTPNNKGGSIKTINSNEFIKNYQKIVCNNDDITKR